MTDSKLRLGLAGLVVGGVLSTAGCANLNDSDWLGAGLKVMSLAHPGLNLTERLITSATGDLVSKNGNRQHDLNAARQGRSQVNVYGNEAYQRTQSYRESIKKRWDTDFCTAFTYNYHKDFNKNNLCDFDEIMGIKNQFKQGESITIGAKIHRPGGTGIANENFVFEVFEYDTGKSLVQREIPGDTGGWRINSVALNSHNLKPGKYLVIAKLPSLLAKNPTLSAHFYDQTIFEILPDSEQTESKQESALEKTTVQEEPKINSNAQSKPAQESDETIENLKKLKEIRDIGILTEEEYQTKRKRMLENAYK